MPLLFSDKYMQFIFLYTLIIIIIICISNAVLSNLPQLLHIYLWFTFNVKDVRISSREYSACRLLFELVYCIGYDDKNFQTLDQVIFSIVPIYRQNALSLFYNFQQNIKTWTYIFIKIKQKLFQIKLLRTILSLFCHENQPIKGFSGRQAFDRSNQEVVTFSFM